MPDSNNISMGMYSRAENGQRNADFSSQINALESKLRSMEWYGAPPIQMQEIQAQIQQLKQKQASNQASQLYDIQRNAMKPEAPGIGGGRNNNGQQRQQEAGMLTNYLQTLFGIGNRGSNNGGMPGRGY